MLIDALASPEKSTIVRLSNAPYPHELEKNVALRDGAQLRIRAIRPADEPRLEALFERLTPQTIYQRFFTWYRRLPAAWYREFANVDYRARLALVAEDVTADGVRLRGIAQWEPGDAPATAEIAVLVEDDWQSRGLGTILLTELFAAARGRGVDRFCADVLAENERMLRLLRRLTEIRASTTEHGVVHLCLVPRASAA